MVRIEIEEIENRVLGTEEILLKRERELSTNW